MAQVIRKTEATFPGPWLLDSAALTALDEIIDEQWLRLEAYKKRQIGQDHESDSGDGRTITLTLSSGNKIRVNSFREAANDVHCQDHEISKIEVKLSCAGIRGDMVVPTPKGELSLVALPEANDAADELFVRLNGWAKQYAPDWLRQVRSWGFPLAWILGLSLLLPVVLLGGMTGAISETIRGAMKLMNCSPQVWGSRTIAGLLSFSCRRQRVSISGSGPCICRFGSASSRSL